MLTLMVTRRAFTDQAAANVIERFAERPGRTRRLKTTVITEVAMAVISTSSTLDMRLDLRVGPLIEFFYYSDPDILQYSTSYIEYGYNSGDSADYDTFSGDFQFQVIDGDGEYTEQLFDGTITSYSSEWFYHDYETNPETYYSGGFFVDDVAISVADYRTLSSEEFTDLLLAGDDAISSAGWQDHLEGREGADSLYGGGGNDTLYGGAGADLLDGGAGTRDRVSYTDSSAGLRADLEVASTNTGIAAGDTYVGIEDLVGSVHGDTVLGNAGANVVFGAEGNDFVYGRDGADSIYGGDGNDMLYGGAGADRIDGDGGTRDRVMYSDSTTGLWADLQAPGTNTGIAAGDTYAEVEDLYGSSHADTLLGDVGGNIIWGANGNDFVYGRNGADSLYGGAGNDILYGGAGADLIDGGAGTRDRVMYSDATAGLRVDLVVASSNTGIAAGDTIAGVEDIYGSNHADVLLGDAGANVIWGSAGNDLIYGRGGADTLSGGAGSDSFVFHTPLGGGNVDTITDYNSAADTIRLDDAVFDAIALGVLSGAAFTVGAAATTAAHRIVYNQTTGELFYDSNGSALGGSVLFARLTPGTVINASDFVVI